MRSIDRQKAFNLALTSAFVALVFLPAVFMWAPAGPSAEKRNLAPLPALTATRAGIEAFPAKFEQFANDHFGFRESFLNLQSYVMRRTFRESSSSRVIFGNDGWLFYTGDFSLPDMLKQVRFSNEELQRWKASIDQRGAWLQQQGIEYRFVVAPDKHTVYREYLPSRYQAEGQTRFQGLLKYVGPSPYLVDLEPALEQRKGKGPDLLYFREDTHWTSYGAYVGYREIMKSLGPQFAGNTLPTAESAIAVDKDAWRVDLAEMARMKVADRSVPRANLMPACGQWSQAMVPLDASADGYIQFLAHKCPARPRTALVFHDSFAEALMPFLGDSFGRVVYVWGEPTDEFFIRMVQQEKPDVVIEERVERSMQYVPEGRLQTALDRIEDATATDRARQASRARQDIYALVQRGATLVADTGGEHIELDGKRWAGITGRPISSGGLDQLKRRGKTYCVTGWAGFPDDKSAADYVLGALGERIVFVAPTSIVRDDVASHFSAPALARSGYNVALPMELTTAEKGPLRLFAVRQRTVSPIEVNPAVASVLTTPDAGKAGAADAGDAEAVDAVAQARASNIIRLRSCAGLAYNAGFAGVV